MQSLRCIASDVFLAAILFMHFSMSGAAAQEPKGKQAQQESNLDLLNRWGKQPEMVQELYTAAFRVLASNPTATFVDVSRDTAVQRLCLQNNIRHLGGPLLGNIHPHGATLWLRTLKPGRVEVRVPTQKGENRYGPVHSTSKSDLSVVVKITGLEPATRYPYRVLVDGHDISLPDNAAITTPAADAQPNQWRLAFGSCFHRWGLGNEQQVRQIIRREPAAMLLIGDMAVQDRNNHLGLHRADYLLRDFFPAWKNLVASIPVYATWDDHDYFANDKAGIPEGYTAQDRWNVRKIFTQSWNNPRYGFGDKRGGLFFRTRIGPCDIIMIDERFFRENREGSLLGEPQMQWLEEQLLDCKGPFIVLSSGTMWSDYVSNGKDSWGRWDPQGREKLFRAIEESRIPGVLFISGDRHGARGFRIPRPSGYQFYEFEVAGLGGRSGPPVSDPAWQTQLYGVADVYVFGEFAFDTTVADPRVTFRLIREDGTVLYELPLTRSQLTPSAL
jgi:alkaline phosphatase D